MSEYQYFEFQTIERPLTVKEMQYLRRYSTRARITAGGFINEYHWGDFKGDADKWMARYFDAYLHVACWGTHTVMLRLPEAVLRYKTVAGYTGENCFAIARADRYNVLTFSSQEDGSGDWQAPEGQLAALIPLRGELAYGDLRALYLGWLLSVQQGEVDSSSGEPEVPPGLGELSASLRSLAEFLRIDQDLLAVAAQASRPISARALSKQDMASLVGKLTGKEKDEFLARLVMGEGAALGAELLQRLTAMNGAPQASAKLPRRRVKELLKAAKEHKVRREEIAAAKAAQEKACRERAAAEARAKYLDSIASRSDALWRKIEGLIATKQLKRYDQAVALLVDLKDLAVRKGTSGEFRPRLEALMHEHARKGTLLRRIQAKGLST